MTESAPRDLPFPYHDVFDTAVQALATEATVHDADPVHGVISASTGINPLVRTYGERIVVRLWQSRPGHTGLAVSSSSRLAYGIDGPKNQQHIDRFLAVLRTRVQELHGADRAADSPRPPPPTRPPPPPPPAAADGDGAGPAAT